MPNRVHLFLAPQVAGGARELIERLGQRHVQQINGTYGHTDTLREGQFPSCLAEEERCLLGCARPIELDPVWARLSAVRGRSLVELPNQ